MAEFDNRFDNEEEDLIDLAGIPEAAEFEPIPLGVHLCRLEFGELDYIGTKGNKGFAVTARVVTPEFCGRIAHDNLFTTESSLPRLVRALRRVGGIEATTLTAGAIQAALNGKLARITVSHVSWTVKGSKSEITEDQAKEARARGETVYGRSTIAFPGYDSPLPEEIAEYGQIPPRTVDANRLNGAPVRDDEDDVPF
jgi:hypothetical protein